MEEATSIAAQIILSLTPIVGIVMGAVVIFFYLLWLHRRRIMLINAGHYERSEFNILLFSLLTGLLLGIVGLVLTVFLAIITGAGYGLLGGLIPLAIGTGLLIFYGIKRHEKLT